ncbi:MAG: transposase [Nitrospirales bacterium]|nr:transposase [Nitrospirales bacterium]
MIDRKQPLPVTRQCDTPELSSSSLYYEPVPLSAGDREVMRLIDEIHLQYPFYGTRKLRDELKG